MHDRDPEGKCVYVYCDVSIIGSPDGRGHVIRTKYDLSID